MLDWISQHQALLSVLINAGMLIVWILYAQLLLRDYRRKLRPKLLINQGLGNSLQSHCFICNMSEQAIYLSLIVAELNTPSQRCRSAITDLEKNTEKALTEATVQGPLKAGEFRDLGNFEAIVNRVVRENLDHPTGPDRLAELEPQTLRIHVIGLYGSENIAVGATREFEFEWHRHSAWLRPTQIDTDRLTSTRERRRIRQLLKDYL